MEENQPKMTEHCNDDVCADGEDNEGEDKVVRYTHGRDGLKSASLSTFQSRMTYASLPSYMKGKSGMEKDPDKVGISKSMSMSRDGNVLKL